MQNMLARLTTRWTGLTYTALECCGGPIARQLTVYRRLVGGALAQAAEDGMLDEADLARWWAWLDQANTEGRFCTATLGFIVAAREP